MYVTADVSWGGESPGKAKAGDRVDEGKIPPTIRERWKRSKYVCDSCSYSGYENGPHNRFVEGKAEQCPGKLKALPPVLSKTAPKSAEE